jgi:hypothetical protein
MTKKAIALIVGTSAAVVGALLWWRRPAPIPWKQYDALADSLGPVSEEWICEQKRKG